MAKPWLALTWTNPHIGAGQGLAPHATRDTCAPTDLPTEHTRTEWGEAAQTGDRGVPTYRVTVGQAGSSHALDVAAALGVEGAILERARSYLGDAAMQVEDMLASVEAQLLRAERARAEAEEAAAEAERRRAEADLIRRDLEKERRAVERTVRSEFQREVQGYREQVKTAMRQLRKERTEAQGERASSGVVPHHETSVLVTPWCFRNRALVALPLREWSGTGRRVRSCSVDDSSLRVGES